MKRYSIHLFNILLVLAVLSCSRPVLPPPAVYPAAQDIRPSGDDLLRKMEALRREPQFFIGGSISLKSPSGNRDGDFAMSIIGDIMHMTVSAGGVQAGRVILENGAVSMEPRLLHDEYLEYMFAVILRDSILWWNITGFEMRSYEPYHLVRNSWKKMYVNPSSLVPERQIFRLMGFRTVEVLYANVMEFGFVRMPTRIEFRYGGYDCVLSIDRVKKSRSRGD